ncbi:MAG: NADP-dependent oxidoreductase [Pseudomonadota bacterium]
MTTNRQAVLVSRPVGLVTNDNFEFRDAPLGEPGDGEILVKVEYVSLDPAMRGWLAEGRSYIPPVGIGEVMRALCAGRVVKSNNDKFREGDAVSGVFGVQEYAISDGKGVQKLNLDQVPMERWIAGLGMPGMTAYFGLLDAGQPKEGDTVLVSGAAGAVGSIVGQIAKIKGCRAVGIAGGPEKCDYVVNELGFDACVDYKAGNLYKDLVAACPDRVDVLFENVGGEIFDTELALMNTFGRVVLCGLISAYNASSMPPGLNNIRSVLVNRLTMRGIIVFDFIDRYGEAVRDMGQWHAEGKLKLKEDVREGGVDAYVDTLNLLFSGGNTGKLVLKL